MSHDYPAKIELHQTMDGLVWAREFCRMTGFRDEEWAFGWFANALMTGWDHRHWRTPEYKAKMAAVTMGNQVNAQDSERDVKGPRATIEALEIMLRDLKVLVVLDKHAVAALKTAHSALAAATETDGPTYAGLMRNSQ